MHARTMMIKLPPLSMGKSTADGIFPDKYKFIALHAATQTPLTIPKTEIFSTVFDFESAAFSTNILPLSFLTVKASVKSEAIVEISNAITRNAYNSPACSDDW